MLSYLSLPNLSPPHPHTCTSGTSYQQIPRKPLDDVMWYGCCSKTDISGERAPHSFQSMTQKFWLQYPNLVLQLPHSSTLSQSWTSCFLHTKASFWSTLLHLSNMPNVCLSVIKTTLYERPHSSQTKVLLLCIDCNNGGQTRTAVFAPRLLRFTRGPLRITSEWGQVVCLSRLCSLKPTTAIYFAECCLEPRDGH